MSEWVVVEHGMNLWRELGLGRWVGWVGWNGIELNRMEWNGMEWNELNGIEWNEWNGVVE